MKVMIFSAATGGGHMRVTEAVREDLNGREHFEAAVFDGVKLLDRCEEKLIFVLI